MFKDLIQHLKDFLKVVDFIDLNGATRNTTRLRLFCFSLHDQAINWLDRLPAGSISTWDDLTTRFLTQFFPPGRTAKLQKDILMFLQHQDESLHDALTRFKDLLQKIAIDYAAGVRLRKLRPKEAWETIEDLAQHEEEKWNEPIFSRKGSPDYIDTTLERDLESMKCRVESLTRSEVLLEYELLESRSLVPIDCETPSFGIRARLIQMARRVFDYRIRRIADRGNEENGPDSRARGDRFYHNRRSTDRGNEKVDRDPRNIFEIQGLQRRVRDLEIQHEIRQIRKRIRELELQREMRKETESKYVIRDDVNEEEEYPSFDSYPWSFEPIYSEFFGRRDIQQELPTDKVQDNPIETPELQKLDVNNDLVDALNINKLDDSHVVEFDASSVGLSHTKILHVINQFLGHQDIDTATNDSNKSVFDTPSELVEVDVSENKLKYEEEDEVKIKMMGTGMDKESLKHNLYENDMTSIICHNFSPTSNLPIKPKDSGSFRMEWWLRWSEDGSGVSWCYYGGACRRWVVEMKVLVASAGSGSGCCHGGGWPAVGVAGQRSGDDNGG
nr:zinc finger, CCHC-type [Tanacetum cinerariifolium]